MTGAKELKLIRLVILQRPARRTCYEPVDSPNPDTQGPETSCEEYNQFLDRGLLIGTFSEPSLGYFSAL